MAKFHTLDGFKIEIIEVAPSTDVRFFTQRELLRLNTDAARAELARRAAIVAGR